MNLILFEPEEAAAGHITLDDRRSQHILKILKLSVGARVRVGIINGPIGTGEITSIEGQSVSFQLNCALPPPPPPTTDLILALPRPIMLKRVLAQTAALGVRHIFLINASKVEKSFFNASLLAAEEIRTKLVHGLEQAVDTTLPTVSIHKRFKPFIEDVLPARITYPIRLLAHPGVDRDLFQQAGYLTSNEAVLAIGPEGGWSTYEVDRLSEAGFRPFSLGPRILRVDSAVPALFGQLNLLRAMKKDGTRKAKTEGAYQCSALCSEPQQGFLD